MKYKVGTKVRVVQCYSGGNFDVGDVVEIIQIGDDDGSAPDCYGAISPYDGMKWYLQEDEVGSNTNADRIRTENDEQLAIFIKELMFNDFKPVKSQPSSRQNISRNVRKIAYHVFCNGSSIQRRRTPDGH